MSQWSCLAGAAGGAPQVGATRLGVWTHVRQSPVLPLKGAGLLMAQAVGRANMGVTLDIGHMLFAGENPAQSVAAAASAGRLFGVQLGDGHQRLGAEDGLMFGSVHPVAALEVVRWLQKSGCAATDHVPCLCLACFAA